VLEIHRRRRRFAAQNLQREIDEPAAVSLGRIAGGADEWKIGALQRGAAPFFNVPQEVVLHKPTGEQCFIEQIIFLIKTDAGYRLGCVMSDITQRKQAEEALRASEDRFRSLVQNAQDIITVHDRNMIVTYESPSVSRLLGYEAGYLIGKSPFDLMPIESICFLDVS